MHLRLVGGLQVTEGSDKLINQDVDGRLTEEFARLLTLWNARRKQRTLPKRSDFPAEDLRAWMGHLGVVRFRPGLKRFLVELAGSMVVRYDGADYTGKFLEDAVPAHALGPIIKPYDLAIKHRRPVFARIAPSILRGRFTYFDRLVLPCGDDGETVDRFIVGIYVSDFDKYQLSIYGEPISPQSLDDESKALGADASSVTVL